MPAYPTAAAGQPQSGAAAAPVRTGPSLEVAIDELLCAGPAGVRAADAVAVLLGSGHAVALRITMDGSGRAAASRLVAACGRLARCLAEAGADTARLCLTLDAAAVSPMLAWRVRQSLLGRGGVDFLVGPQDFEPAQSQRVRRRWSELWRLRGTPARIAFWPEVRSACPLLASEPADALLPPVGLQAPGNSAWLVYTLDLGRLPANRGVLSNDVVEQAVAKIFDDAAANPGEGGWPTARQAEDAWFNRRVGMRISGIGNVARRCGLDPGATETFVHFDRLLAGVRGGALEHARRGSIEGNLLPAVAATNPAARFAPGSLRDAWHERWQRLVDSTAIAHRNLLVMSPWSLFPDNHPARNYAQLLPLLRHADACCFDRRPRLDAWSLEEFVELHRRAWSFCTQSGGRPVVAEPP